MLNWTQKIGLIVLCGSITGLAMGTNNIFPYNKNNTHAYIQKYKYCMPHYYSPTTKNAHPENLRTWAEDIDAYVSEYLNPCLCDFNLEIPYQRQLKLNTFINRFLYIQWVAQIALDATESEDYILSTDDLKHIYDAYRYHHSEPMFEEFIIQILKEFYLKSAYTPAANKESLEILSKIQKMAKDLGV